MYSQSSSADCAASCAAISSPHIQVNRNTVSSLINLVFNNYEDIDALDYAVADQTGKILLHGHWPVNKGQNKTIVNLSLLNDGDYWLSIADKSNGNVLVRQQVAR